VEVSYKYTRNDWTLISTECSRRWLHRLKPLTAKERVGYIFFLSLSLLALTALLTFLAVAHWLGFAWYYLASAALLLPFPCLIIHAVVWPSAGKNKRGLYHELLFQGKLEDGAVAKFRDSHDRRLRRMEAAGQLNLAIRYTLRLDPEELVQRVAWEDVSTTQEHHYSWGNVLDIERGEQLLIFSLADVGILCVPRSAFASAEQEGEFLASAERFRRISREGVLASVGEGDREPGRESF
jgi:hypothetical protein